MVGAPGGGGWGGYSLEWPIQGYAAGQGMVFYLPPRPPRGAVMLVMTTDAQERKQQNFTRQHNAITQRRHVFGNNHDILMNPFYLWFEISSTTSNQRQPWKLLDLQEIIIIKKHLVLKDQCQYNQLLLGRTPLGWLLCVCLREMNAL